MNPELSLLYVHSSGVSEDGVIGYGRLGVQLAKALQQRGVDVYDHLNSPDAPKRMGDQIVETGRVAKDTNVVCWVSVPTHARGWWSGQHAAIFTMYETNHLPESFRETLHEFQTVIVPSDANVELFSEYHPNVHKVLLGVDPTRWHYTPREDPGIFFNFLIGGSGKRKGTDLAYRAFNKVFGNWHGTGPIPRLVMKNPKGEDFHGSNVEIVSGHLSDADEINLYAAAHCYLQPSRGEGFGLQPLQAIAQGCPTILTNGHGHASFAGLGIPIGWDWTKADYFIYGESGDWWEPDFGQLCDAMAHVYENYDAEVARAKDSAAVVAKDFTWANTAEQFTNVFGDELTKPFPAGEWFRPQVKRYLVMVNRVWVADIAGTKYRFEPGEKYWELADVKRILFEAGLLDVACLLRPDDPRDLGLTEGQLEHLDDYTAAHAHCHTCGQRLGTSPTRADEMWLELEAAR